MNGRSVDDLVNGRWMMCSMDERVLWARGFGERESARWMRECYGREDSVNEGVLDG